MCRWVCRKDALREIVSLGRHSRGFITTSIDAAVYANQGRAHWVQTAVRSKEATPCLPRMLVALFGFLVHHRCERNLHPPLSFMAFEFLNVVQAKPDSPVNEFWLRLPDHHAPVFVKPTVPTCQPGTRSDDSNRTNSPSGRSCADVGVGMWRRTRSVIDKTSAM